jgi:hypothetical protein
MRGTTVLSSARQARTDEYFRCCVPPEKIRREPGKHSAMPTPNSCGARRQVVAVQDVDRAAFDHLGRRLGGVRAAAVALVGGELEEQPGERDHERRGRGLLAGGEPAGVHQPPRQTPKLTTQTEDRPGRSGNAVRLLGGHTDAATERGLEQQAVFREEGVDLGRVVIGHSGDTTDLTYLRKLMDAGSYIGMDRFGLDLMLPFEDRVATVAALCAEGYAGRIVLSHDASCFTHNFEVEKKRELLPRWVYTHLHDDVLPALRERGVTEDQIEQMLVTNPRAILAG